MVTQKQSILKTSSKWHKICYFHCIPEAFPLSLRIQIHGFIVLMLIHSRFKGAVTWDDSLLWPTFTLTRRPCADGFISILKEKNWFTWGLSCSHSYVKWHQQQQGHDFRTKAAVTLQALMLGSNHSALKVPISYPILYIKCPTSLTVNKPVPWNHLHVHSSTQE